MPVMLSRIPSLSDAVMPVSMYPGATTLTRTPRLATSRARLFEKPMMPAFEAQ